MLHARGASHSNRVHTNRVLRVDIERGGKHVYRVTETLDRGFGIATIDELTNQIAGKKTRLFDATEKVCAKRESTILEFNGKYVRGSKFSIRGEKPDDENGVR